MTHRVCMAYSWIRVTNSQTGFVFVLLKWRTPVRGQTASFVVCHIITAKAIRIRNFFRSSVSITYLCFPFPKQLHSTTFWIDPCCGIFLLFMSQNWRLSQTNVMGFSMSAFLEQVIMWTNYRQNTTVSQYVVHNKHKEWRIGKPSTAVRFGRM
jgi:hypothetical protein